MWLQKVRNKLVLLEENAYKELTQEPQLDQHSVHL